MRMPDHIGTAMLLVVAAAVVLTTTAFALSFGEKSGINELIGIAPTSEDFVKEAIVSDIFEIQAGKLALSKARKTQVKEFGATLVNDHARISKHLKSLLESGKIKKARAPDVLDSVHTSMLEKLQASNGDEFDEQFLSDAITDHKNVISLYERYARHGDNDELQRFAIMYLPTLQYDLNVAQSTSGEY